MKIIGIDPGISCCGLVVLDDEKHEVFSYAIKETNGTRIDRCIAIARFIRNRADASSLFFMEDYSYGAKTGENSLPYMGELGGILKSMVLSMTGKHASTVAINTWKKFLCGKHNLAKDSFKLEVFRKFNAECGTNDVAAAYAIADFGYAIATGKSFDGREFKKYELECLKNFQKKKS